VETVIPIDLRGASANILALLHLETRGTEFVPIKTRWAARVIGAHHSTVIRALHNLERGGYVRRGQQKRGRLVTYRLTERLL